MREYQVAIVKLAGRGRDDEEILTDLLNERERSGWAYHEIAGLGDGRVAVVFARHAP
jgi:hypothetical protein